MKLLGYILLAIFVALVTGFITMTLWNWLVPSIFGIRAITLWEALGLMLLSSCFFWRGK